MHIHIEGKVMLRGGATVKRFYLLLAIAGLIVPYYFLILFVSSHGLDVKLLIDELFANHISTFFAWDLIITAIVF